MRHLLNMPRQGIGTILIFWLLAYYQLQVPRFFQMELKGVPMLSIGRT